jgi:hypothetical protein
MPAKLEVHGYWHGNEVSGDLYVYSDGTTVAKTTFPAIVELPPGTYELQLVYFAKEYNLSVGTNTRVSLSEGEYKRVNIDITDPFAPVPYPPPPQPYPPPPPPPVKYGYLSVSAYVMTCTGRKDVGAIVTIKEREWEGSYLTPCNLTLPEGTYTVVLERSEPPIRIEKTVVIEADKTTRLEVEFPWPYGCLEVHAYYDNMEVNATVSIEWAPGAVEATLTTPFVRDETEGWRGLTARYGDWVAYARAYVKVGATTKVLFRFPPTYEVIIATPEKTEYIEKEKKGTLRVRAFVDSEEVRAVVQIEGVPGYFDTPLEIRIPIGTYKVTCGYLVSTLEKTVTIEEGKTTEVVFNFSKKEIEEKVVIKKEEEVKVKKGTLQVEASIDGQKIVATVDVYKDSNRIGTYETPFILELEEGTYKLKATYENLKETRTATVVAGKVTYVEIEFKRVEMPKKAEVPWLLILIGLGALAFATKER